MLNVATTSEVSWVFRSFLVIVGVVQPQLVRTPTTRRSSLYLLRNTNRCSVFAPRATLPKLWLVSENICLAQSWARAGAALSSRSPTTTTNGRRSLPKKGRAAHMGVSPEGVRPAEGLAAKDLTKSTDAMEGESTGLWAGWADNGVRHLPNIPCRGVPGGCPGGFPPEISFFSAPGPLQPRGFARMGKSLTGRLPSRSETSEPARAGPDSTSIAGLCLVFFGFWP